MFSQGKYLQRKQDDHFSCPLKLSVALANSFSRSGTNRSEETLKANHFAPPFLLTGSTPGSSLSRNPSLSLSQNPNLILLSLIQLSLMRRWSRKQRKLDRLKRQTVCSADSYSELLKIF